MPRAFLQIRAEPCYRREAFAKGLTACGYEVHGNVMSGSLAPTDVLVIWNRYGHWDVLAKRFEAAGARVLVAENGYMGRDWQGDHWYALARSFHNGAGWTPNRGPERWNACGMALQPWRLGGHELVILQTRGIGCEGIREPHHWSQTVAASLEKSQRRPVRIRKHPGEAGLGPPLEEDLADAWAVVTWGSGAALKALAAGVPVFYGFDRWIGRRAARSWQEIEHRAVEDRARFSMFDALAWAMWRTSEIERGEPFRQLL